MNTRQRTVAIVAAGSLAAFLAAACGLEAARKQLAAGPTLNSKQNDMVAISEKSVPYGNEWLFNRHSKAEPPQLCLSLSGGGMRSAAFSIGVLAGLKDEGIINQIDVMSSVSGGSYALTWYFLQHYYRNFADPQSTRASVDFQFSDDQGEWQRHLENNARLMTPLLVVEEVTAVPATMIGEIALKALFDPSWNLGHKASKYEEALYREFEEDPFSKSADAEKEVAAKNGISFGSCLSGRKDFPTVEQIDSILIDRSLPSFVINGTSTPAGKPLDSSTPVLNTVFEMAPFWFGAPNVGYWPPLTSILHLEKFDPLKFGQLVYLSGAAVDVNYSLKSTGIVGTTALSLGDLGLGMDVNLITGIHPVGCAPRAVVDDKRWAHVADGGLSENLGLWSLMQRRCQNMIVVDAEEDKDFKFPSYHSLKKNLPENVTMSVPIVDSGNFDSAQQKVPVLSGSIGYSEQQARVAYIKLAIDRTATNDYPSAVREEANRDKQFPQDSTLNQDFSPERFRAYGDLGRFIVQQAATRGAFNAFHRAALDVQETE
jgi:hypothetical protein